jgi:hypothetical protein
MKCQTCEAASHVYSVKVIGSASLTQRLFLPLMVWGAEPSETCSELLVNGGAEMDQVWESDASFHCPQQRYSRYNCPLAR